MTEQLVVISRQEAKTLDLKYYYTGKPCKHGHLERRYVSNGACPACLVDRFQKTPASTKSKWQREYRERNRVKYLKRHSENMRRWREQNPEKALAADERRNVAKRQRYREKMLSIAKKPRSTSTIAARPYQVFRNALPLRPKPST